MKPLALVPLALLTLGACMQTAEEATPAASVDARLAAAVAANGCTLTAENTAKVLADGGLTEDDITSAVTTLTMRGQVRASGNVLIFSSPGCA